MVKVPMFKIGDETFPFPTRYRIGDALVIEELTGLDMETFGRRVDESTKPHGDRDLKALVGMIAAAVWQAHPDWPQARVIAFVNAIDFDNFNVLKPDAPEVTDGPPAEPAETPATDSSSPASSGESTTSAGHSVAGVPV